MDLNNCRKKNKLTAINLKKYIDDYGHVSFAELTRDFEGFEGDELMFAGDAKKNVVLWANISGNAVKQLNSLVKNKPYSFKPCNLLIYIVDGVCLKLPVAKRLSKQGYKKPRWLPCVLVKE